LRQYLSWFRQMSRPERGEAPEQADVCPARAASHAREMIERLRLLAGDLVCVHCGDGSVAECDITATGLGALDAADLAGDRFIERVHVGDRPLVLEALSRARHGMERVTVELRLDLAAGNGATPDFRWLELTASRLAVDDDADARVITLSRDISRFKAREAELHAACRAAEEANEAKTRFLHSMSHELRTPLNAIIGFSEMMSLPGICVRDERQMNEYAGIVHNSGKHLLGLIDEVLDMSRLEAGKYRLSPETFGVADLVRHAIELVQHEMEAKGVRISLREFDAGLAMTADRRVCRQVLVNLLAAQIKSVAPRERLRLRIEADERTIAFIATGAAAAAGAGERRPAAGLLAPLAALIGGELRAVATPDGQDGLEVRLPLKAGAPAADGNIVRLRTEAPAETAGRQLSA
jgi:cell cycle sensor histidine kinase DivJ